MGDVLYGATRYTGVGDATKMRAAASWFDITTGNELLTMRSGPNFEGRARTYATDILVDGRDIYVLYRGDLNGSELIDGSQVHLAKFSNNGQWFWGRSYDLTNFSGEHGLNLEKLDSDLIISGNGYGTPDLFSMRVSQANGNPVCAVGYHNTNEEALRMRLYGGQKMVVTSNVIVLADFTGERNG